MFTGTKTETGRVVLPAPLSGRFPRPRLLDQRHEGHHLLRRAGQRRGRCRSASRTPPGTQGRDRRARRQLCRRHRGRQAAARTGPLRHRRDQGKTFAADF